MHDSLVGKNIAIIFEKTSTRTRCSFEVAHDLGMHVTYLDPESSQFGKRKVWQIAHVYLEECSMELNIVDTDKKS